MKPNKPRNIAASHRAKLLALAHERKEDFQFLLGRWVVERFLFRLSQSEHADRFVLKGAMLFIAWEGKMHRPTKDLDLLSYGSPDVNHVVETVREVCSAAVDDGLQFDLAAVEGWRIKEDAEYEGVRVEVPASLDGARVQMQIDIGFGDLVEPAPKLLKFPVLLPMDAPMVRAYPPEAVVAEKFHAMVLLGIANSRMKDFYDIWMLVSSHTFEMDSLARHSKHVRAQANRPTTGCSFRIHRRVSGGRVQANAVACLCRPARFGWGAGRTEEHRPYPRRLPSARDRGRRRWSFSVSARDATWTLGIAAGCRTTQPALTWAP